MAWGRELKDGRSVEAEEYDRWHADYNPRGCSDIPVNVGDQETGQGFNLTERAFPELSEFQHRQRDEDERRACKQVSGG